MLCIVRHGESEWNVIKRLQGQKDIPLSKKGIQQAKKLATHFIDQNIHFEHVFTSDLKRANQTAQWLTEAMPISGIKTETALRERYYGELEGRLITDIVDTLPDFQINFGVPMRYGMESLEDMQERMVTAITNIAKMTEGAPTLIVSHGGAINAFLHRITNGEIGTGKGKLANTSITQLRWLDDSFEIEAYNHTPHL